MQETPEQRRKREIWEEWASVPTSLHDNKSVVIGGSRVSGGRNWRMKDSAFHQIISGNRADIAMIELERYDPMAAFVVQQTVFSATPIRAMAGAILAQFGTLLSVARITDKQSRGLDFLHEYMETEE